MVMTLRCSEKIGEFTRSSPQVDHLDQKHSGLHDKLLIDHDHFTDLVNDAALSSIIYTKFRFQNIPNAQKKMVGRWIITIYSFQIPKYKKK